MSVFDAKTEALPRSGLQSLVGAFDPGAADAGQDGLPNGGALDLETASKLSRSGLLIVDQGCVVRYLNARAHAMLARNGVIGISNGRLTIERKESQRSFESLLERGIAASSAITPASSSTMSEAIGIPDRSGAARYALCIVNVHRSDGHAEVLLSLTDFADNSGPARSTFSTVLGLSVREAELAELFSQGLGLEEIATTMGIAFNTARVHLQRICLKTNCSGQIALTRLLCRLSSMPLPTAVATAR